MLSAASLGSMSCDIPIHQVWSPASPDFGIVSAPDLATCNQQCVWEGNTLLPELPTIRGSHVCDCSRLLCLVAHVQPTCCVGTRNVAVAFTAVPQLVQLTKEQPRATFLTAVRSDLDAPGGLAAPAAKLALQTAQAMTPSALWQSHVASWADVWASGIEVCHRCLQLHGLACVCDEAHALAHCCVGRRSLATILSAPPSTAACSTSFRPCGPTGHTDYPQGACRLTTVGVGGGQACGTSLTLACMCVRADHGHSFWDTETWMYPNLLLLAPDVAASLLEYRALRLGQAEVRHASVIGMLQHVTTPRLVGRCERVSTGSLEPCGRGSQRSLDATACRRLIRRGDTSSTL